MNPHPGPRSDPRPHHRSEASVPASRADRFHPVPRQAVEGGDVADVVVVGAGAAGLLAAHRLGTAGLSVVVVEAADRVGGRMASDRRDGFRLDRASQLLLPNRPELQRLPRPLPLRPLTAGVLVRGAARTVRVGTGDTDFPRIGVGPELTAAAALRRRGLPARVTEGTLRPLLATLLGDPELASSSRLGELRLRAFARRGLALPAAAPAHGGVNGAAAAAGGAAAAGTVPDLLAGALPQEVTIRTGTRAVSVATTAVETESTHGPSRRRRVVRCRAVVVATGVAEAARLLPGLRLPPHRPATVLHHAAPAALAGEPALIVDAARRGPIAHTMVASAADPGRAPQGWRLVTSVVLGPRAAEPAELLDKAVRPQLAELYDTPAEEWELLATHHDPRAVPVASPPYRGPRRVRLLDGIYVCGDHRDAPGLTGDLASAERAADALLADAGLHQRV
ncbi:FAD-dependent oxidoreductase [Streptomyces sp. 4N509B]|uniref:FAD-dependent oxidoreductase n=1 Tax=Streptomyces sp. 4N509B TaxID=3457413 RepID=UPI003FD62F75